MKYIDADKLIAEMRRQKRGLELSIQSQGDYGQSCHIVAYENIISIIGSLQQEQPVEGLEEADLKKEIIRFQREDMDRDTTVGDVARHFYELGCRHAAEMYDDIEYNRQMAEEK